jgi:hypothetical protein
VNPQIAEPFMMVDVISKILSPSVFYTGENVFITTRKIAFTLNDIQHYDSIAEDIEWLQELLTEQLNGSFLVPGENLHLTQTSSSFFQITSLNSDSIFSLQSLQYELIVPFSLMFTKYNKRYINSLYLLKNQTDSQASYYLNG